MRSSKFRCVSMHSDVLGGVQAFSERYPSVNFYKIDVDELEELTMYAGVDCMPTFQLYKNGEHTDTIEGAHSKMLEEMIQNKLLL